MFILELAAQGVRGFSPTCRAALKPGYWLLKAPPGNAVPLAHLASATLYADGRGGDAVFLAPGTKQGRVAFALMGNDQITYRLIRQLGGAGALQRFNAQTQQMERVSEDVGEIAQFLKGQVGLPAKGAFEAVFTLSPQQLPSLKPKGKPLGKSPTGPSGPKPQLQSAMAVSAASDPAAARAKLVELERELHLSAEVGEIQFKIDGLASQGFELEQRLSAGERLRAAVSEAEAAVNAAPSPERLQLPPDIVSKLERYPQVVARRDEALAKLGAERAPEEEVFAPSTAPEPLWKDQRFLAGIGLGAATLVGGMIASGWARYVALVDIPAFGFSALVALQWVDRLQGSQRVTQKGGRLDLREKKIRDQFEAEAQDAKRAISVLGVEGHEEAIAAFAAKARLEEKLRGLQDELAQLEQDPEFAAAASQYQQVRAEQEALNAQLLERGGSYFRDAREVEREIARVRESIALAENPASAAPVAVSAAAPVEALEDPSPALLACAADLFTLDVPGACAVLKDRAVQYLAALTDKRYLGLELDRDGKATVLAAAGGKVPAGTLAPRDLDQLYLSLKLTLIEKYSARFKVPLLVDDGAYVEEMKLALLGRMLKHLGSLTQVLHVSGAPALEAAADGSVAL